MKRKYKKKLLNFIENHLSPFVKDKGKKRINVLRVYSIIAFLFFCSAHTIKLFIDRGFDNVYVATATGLFATITSLNVWRSNSKRKGGK